MNNNFNNFNNMDDLFNQLMGGMRGYSSENRRYLINGREVTPEEFAHYRATGQLPGNAETDGQIQQKSSGMKRDGVLAKLGRNLTSEAREGKLDPVIGRNKEIQETSEILSRRTKNNPVLVGDAGVGKTAGYVGYDDNSNTLTERVRRNPYSIILLDEIEKADPQVITLLLQVLDDGRLTDGQGNTVNFKNTVIIATSNAGFGYESNLTEDSDKPELMNRLKPFFRPEFLNRFNAVIEFSHLTKEDLSKIVDLMLLEVNQTLAKKDIDLEVSQSAKEYITEEGYDEVMGVRPLRRVVEQEIRDKVTDFHLDNLDAKHLEADMEDGALVILKKI